MRVTPSRLVLAAIASAGFAMVSVPAFAQSVDELTVTGHYRNADTISAVVGYGDLDLTTAWGQTELKSRIKATAHDLCKQLGEDDSGASALAPTCVQDAVASANGQMRMAFDQATPRSLAYIPPAPAATEYIADVSTTEPVGSPTYTMTTVTNGPVADTPENRARYGQPDSRAGRMTAPRGN
jgi:UrcA family protein